MHCMHANLNPSHFLFFCISDRGGVEDIPLSDVSFPDQVEGFEPDVIDPRELTCKYALVTSLDPVLINVTPHVINALQDIQQVEMRINPLFII